MYCKYINCFASFTGTSCIIFCILELPKKSVHLMFLAGNICCLAEKEIAQHIFVGLGVGLISLCSNCPLQTEVLLTHQIAMVITNTSADLLQPGQGQNLRVALQLVSKCLTDRWWFRTVSVKVKPSHHTNKKKNSTDYSKLIKTSSFFIFLSMATRSRGSELLFNSPKLFWMELIQSVKDMQRLSASSMLFNSSRSCLMVSWKILDEVWKV